MTCACGLQETCNCGAAHVLHTTELQRLRHENLNLMEMIDQLRKEVNLLLEERKHWHVPSSQTQKTGNDYEH